MITPEDSVDSVLRLGPAYAKLLGELGFDTCCGGHRSLSSDAQEHGIEISKALARLRALEAGQGDADQ
ncbi:MAG: DUF542 domain-containing protein [Thermaerobacter sp.]|nr:DUF542 domain-containing protein [Thermaerobacter sp.]